MVDPTEKDTKHIKDQSMCTEEKGKRGKQKELDMLPSQTAYPAGFETSTPGWPQAT